MGFRGGRELEEGQLSFDSVKRLVSRGLLTSLQLEGEKFASTPPRTICSWQNATGMLEKYTRLKMVTQLDSDIQAAEVKWRNEQDSHRRR